MRNSATFWCEMRPQMRLIATRNGMRPTRARIMSGSVAAQLGVRSVEHFLPTYSSVRRWKDRRVTLNLPLFPG